MNPTEIEFAVKALVAGSYDPAAFVFDLIAIYNAPKVTVSKLRSGQTNASKVSGDVLWKKHLYFRAALPTDDVAAVADDLANDSLVIKDNPRFILVTNGETVHIRDRQLDDTCNIEFHNLDESFDFLLPLAGFERRITVAENPADVKAAKRLAKLYDAILAANHDWTDGHHNHELNLFMTRMIFCFYAEDTGIFSTRNLFTDTVTQHTSENGADVAPLLDRLFSVMNVPDSVRPKDMSAIDVRFPYVNGSLFEVPLPIPVFTRTCRRLFLECGALDWQKINPDIFGSMIQTIAEPGARGDLGMHYTSVPNIMKVLAPLFLDDLNEAYDKANSIPKLEALLVRLAAVRVFDPACGSGNFLIVAYKELRQLEMRVLSRIERIAANNPLRFSGIVLQNFYGIDIADFACETAKLSLWIAEYQMNSSFKELFGAARPPLPLGRIGTIHCNNAVTTDWLTVCPFIDGAETYVCGNPPYQGAVGQSREQRNDVIATFAPILAGNTDLDYVACWLIKLADYISVVPDATGAFVATKSICQGEQVAFIWPYVFSLNVRIQFAHTAFKWANSATHNAGVTCVIVGVGKSTTRPSFLYSNSYKKRTSSINAYLIAGEADLVVTSSARPLNALPDLIRGSQPLDGGNFILSRDEKTRLLSVYPAAGPLLRRFYSAEDVLYNAERYTLWIRDQQLPLAMSIQPIATRLAKVRQDREAGGRDKKRASSTPHKYVYDTNSDLEALAIPGVSSERRPYLQISVLQPPDIVSHALYVIYAPPPYLFALLSSRLHYIWAITVGGHMRMDIRYSSTLVYNTFPAPAMSAEQERSLSDHSKAIVKARAKHPGKTTAWLYNPATMPANLLQAHQESDAYLELCVYGREFRDDTHRLEHLFAMYAALKARADTPLFAASVRAKPKKASF